MDSVAFWQEQQVFITKIIFPGVIVVLVLTPALLVLAVFGFARRWRLWRVGRPEPLSDHWWTRLTGTLAVSIPHVRFISRGELYPGLMHLFIFGGTALLFLGKIVRLFLSGVYPFRPRAFISTLHSCRKSAVH